MRFDPNLHFQCPEGFTHDGEPMNWRDYKPDPSMRSDFKAEDLEIGGLTCHVRAALSTKFKKPILRKLQVTNQNAYIQLFIDKRYEGKKDENDFFKAKGEKAEDEFSPALRSLDTEKIKIADQISDALAEQLEARGYECKIDNLGVRIFLMDTDASPIEEFAKIYKILKGIEAACNRGQKPLGDIDSLSENWRPPHTIFSSINDSLEEKEEKEAWRSRIVEPDEQQQTDEKREKTRRLVEKYFPTGIAVTKPQHELFMDEIENVINTEQRKR